MASTPPRSSKSSGWAAGRQRPTALGNNSNDATVKPELAVCGSGSKVAPGGSAKPAPGMAPYTEALLAAVPLPDPALKRTKHRVEGDVPSPINPPSGCHFHPRCPYAVARCKTEVPLLRDVGTGRQVACHLR